MEQKHTSLDNFQIRDFARLFCRYQNNQVVQYMNMWKLHNTNATYFYNIKVCRISIV